MTDQKSRKFPVLLSSVIIFVLFNALIALFRPFFGSFFLVNLYELSLFLFEIIFLIIAIVFAFKGFKKNKLQALLPLIILAIGIIFLLLITRGITPQKIFFTTRESQMMQVVNLVKENKLKVIPDSSAETYSFYHLPNQMKYLSEYERVGVDNQNNNQFVFFNAYITFAGIEGFIYSKNESAPQLNPRLFGFEYAQIRKLNNNWYSVNLY